MDTSGCPAEVAGSQRPPAIPDIHPSVATSWEGPGNLGGDSRVTRVTWGAVRGLRVAAIYQLTGKYLNILTVRGHSGAAGLNIRLSAPETPHKDVALKREEDVKDDQVEQLGI